MPSDYSVPFPRAYWVIPGLFLAGEYPGAKDITEARQKIENLYHSGIRHVFNLMEPAETDHSGKPFHSYEQILNEIAAHRSDKVCFSRYPIKDQYTPDTEQMAKILDDIDASIEQRQPVYVHCWGAIGRTGTVVGCFLIRHGRVYRRFFAKREIDPSIC